MGTDQPVVGPNTAAQLRAYAAQPEPELATTSQVEVMITKLAIATAQAKVSQAEADERLDLYWLALRDLPLVDLRAAFSGLLKSAKFLPTPAEVRAAALLPGARRRYAKSRARHLAWKHDVEWRAPTEMAPPDEVLKLLSGASNDAAQRMQAEQ